MTDTTAINRDPRNLASLPQLTGDTPADWTAMEQALFQHSLDGGTEAVGGTAHAMRLTQRIVAGALRRGDRIEAQGVPVVVAREAHGTQPAQATADGLAVDAGDWCHCGRAGRFLCSPTQVSTRILRRGVSITKLWKAKIMCFVAWS